MRYPNPRGLYVGRLHRRVIGDGGKMISCFFPSREGTGEACYPLAVQLRQSVTERNRMFLLIMIMITICMAVAGISMWVLYETAFDGQRERLIVSAKSQARLIEAMARYDAIYSKGCPEDPLAAMLSQIADAHENYKGFGETGEFTLARREGEEIVFLLSHRHDDLGKPNPVRFDSKLAEPMRRALSGQSGASVGLDYRGEKVLAAYEPVAGLGLGVVAKIDLSEVRAPFMRAATMAIGITILFASLGTAVFLRVGIPIVERLKKQSEDLDKTHQDLVEETKERMAAQKALSQTLELYRAVVNDQTELVMRWKPGGIRTFVNDAYCKCFEQAREELIGTSFMPLVAEEDRKSVEDKIARLSPTNPSGMDERRGIKPDGSIIWHEWVDRAVFDTRGRLVEFQSVGRDITQRKQAEEALRENEERFRTLIRTIPESGAGKKCQKSAG
jgi:PAS domain S-box-containing protein